MSRAIGMIGERFGDLLVMREAGRAGDGKIKWISQCGCGSEFAATGVRIRSGEVITCPACSAERVRLSVQTHGERTSSEYRAWTHAKSRCFNSNVPEFKNYGGRGISMCDRWRNSFERFLEDMGRRLSSGHSIDRIDVNGNYEPGNCRWATSKEQANNKRCNRLIEISGETRTMAQWADLAGLSRETMLKRVKKGFTGKSLIAPSNEPDTLTFQGVTASIPEWSKITGIQKSTLYWRLNSQSWDIEKALTKGARKCA